jgi:hypothetical protein
MNIFELIKEDYDVRRLRNRCNYKDCDRYPSKEILIYETDFKKIKTRDLVSLYLCIKHFKEANENLIKKLSEIEVKDKRIDVRVSDLGFRYIRGSSSTR